MVQVVYTGEGFKGPVPIETETWVDMERKNRTGGTLPIHTLVPVLSGPD